MTTRARKLLDTVFSVHDNGIGIEHGADPRGETAAAGR